MLTQQQPLLDFVAGAFVDAPEGDPIQSVNPTQPSDVVSVITPGSVDRVAQAAAKAAEAQRAWAKLPGPARAEHLYRWGKAILDRSDELALAVVREVGKPIGEAKGEVGRCAAILSYYAGEAVREVGEVIPAQTANSLQFTLREPLGVVGLITPWNFPLAIPLWKAAPALAFGNAVVLKPAEASSYIGFLLAETAKAAGLPPGVFNVVQGNGHMTGTALLHDDNISAISFTGSEAVGLKVATACARRNIRFQTEMGGKNVGIVLEDADLSQAAALVAGGAMRYAGQKCTATSRVVVQAKVMSGFLQALHAAAAALPMGDPSEPQTAIGPVISRESQERLNDALGVPDYEQWYRGKVDESADGFFVSPTVFIDVPPDARIAQDELFGPVLAVIEAADADEAIEIANKSRFGLSASLYTQNLRNAMDYVRRIEVGMVRVNGDTTGVDPHAPFGGMKNSSSHSREQGPAAREFYTELKTVQINA